MTNTIEELVIRNIAPVDTTEIIDLVAAATWDGPVSRWLDADPAARRRESAGYFEIFVEHAVRYGEVYATADADTTGSRTDVALRSPFMSMIPPPADREIRPKEATGSSGYDCQTEIQLPDYGSPRGTMRRSPMP
jgi:hypothetical protein